MKVREIKVGQRVILDSNTAYAHGKALETRYGVVVGLPFQALSGKACFVPVRIDGTEIVENWCTRRVILNHDHTGNA